MSTSRQSRTHIERLETSREKSWLHYANLSLKWNELSNNRSAELSKHLFTIAALILPISLIPITQENFNFATNIWSKGFLIISWIAFIVSLTSGLKHLSDEIKFFDDWSEQESKKSKQFVEPIRTSNEGTAYEAINKMHDEADTLDLLPKTMDQKYLKIQQKALVFGIIAIGIVLATKLFFIKPENESFLDNCWNHNSIYKNEKCKSKKDFSFRK